MWYGADVSVHWQEAHTTETGGALEAMIANKADSITWTSTAACSWRTWSSTRRRRSPRSPRREPILFTDGEDVVRGSLAQDASRGWVGIADWSTQDLVESYPRSVAVG